MQVNKMQDHDDNSDDNIEDDAGGKALSDLYAALSQDQPPKSLDDKVLAAAHDKVASDVVAAHSSFSKKQSASPFSGRWMVPASLAAVVVLSVVVITMIEKKRPYSITSLPEPTRIEQSSAEQARPDPVTEERKKGEQNVQGKSEQQAVVANRRDDLAQPQVQNQSPPLAKAIKSVPQAPQPLAKESIKETIVKETIKEKRLLQPAESRSTDVEKAPASNVPSEKEHSSGVVDAQLEKKISAAVTPGNSSAVLPGKSTLEDQSTTLGDEFVDRASATPDMKRPAIKTDSVASSDSGAVPLPPSKIAVARENVSDSQPKPTVEQVAGFASSAVAPAGLIEPKARLTMPSESKVPTACHLISMSDCVQSTECTLNWNSESSSYQCRKNENRCENNFSQAVDSPQSCTSKPGCKFVPENCFCLPDTECDCSGGPPAMCMPEQ